MCAGALGALVRCARAFCDAPCVLVPFVARLVCSGLGVIVPYKIGYTAHWLFLSSRALGEESTYSNERTNPLLFLCDPLSFFRYPPHVSSSRSVTPAASRTLGVSLAASQLLLRPEPGGGRPGRPLRVVGQAGRPERRRRLRGRLPTSSHKNCSAGNARRAVGVLRVPSTDRCVQTLKVDAGETLRCWILSCFRV